MQAVWASLKENVNCVSKLTTVVGRPENNCGRKGYDSRNEKLEKELVHKLRNPFREALFRPNYPKTQFYGKVFSLTVTLRLPFSVLISLQR